MKVLLNISHNLVFSLLASLLLYINSNAQERGKKLFERYFQRIWQSEQGLPHNAGRSFVQTYDGYLWIGSQDGLVRYNGKEFLVFTKYNTPELKHNDITALLETPDSSLWIGTFNGLTRYKKGVFTYHSPNAGIEKEVIRALAADRAGNIWIGTMNAGIQKYRDGKFEYFTTAEGLSNNSINGIAEDFQGNLWVSTLIGISVYKNGVWVYYNYNKNITNNSGQDILVAQDSSVWIGTNSGLMRWKNNSFRTFTTADGLSDNVIQTNLEHCGSELNAVVFVVFTITFFTHTAHQMASQAILSTPCLKIARGISGSEPILKGLINL
jgi:ligand-binding sensor domain-containing protein